MRSLASILLIGTVGLALNCLPWRSADAQQELPGQVAPQRRPSSSEPPTAVPPVAEQPAASPLDSVAPQPAPRRRATRASNDDLLNSLLADSRTRTRRARNRLARTPEYFGDNFIGGDMIALTGVSTVRTDLPLAAGSRRAKIADHNKAYPVDRVFLNYHHFHGAQDFARNGVLDSGNIDRFTFGFEKTFDAGQSSIEMRLPLADDVNYGAADFELSGGHFGNLAVILKRLLVQTDCVAMSYGMGVDLPTGSDVRGRTPINGVNFEVENDSVHLLPYIGIVGAPSDLFYHASLQLDITLNGNDVIADQAGVITRGVLTEDSLMYLDLSAGYWLLRKPEGCGRGLTGLAAIAEMHLTSMLRDGDFVSLAGGLTSFGFAGDRTIPNVTFGLHAEIDYDTKLRIGTAFPLSDDDLERFFDSEVMLSLIRHY